MQKWAAQRRRFYVFAGVVVGLVGSLVVPPRTSLAQLKVPPDLTFSATGDQPPVIFSHTVHAVDHKLQCTGCHVKLFQMKAGGTAAKHGKLTMEAMVQGQFCGACHDGKSAFSVQVQDTCSRCHIRK